MLKSNEIGVISHVPAIQIIKLKDNNISTSIKLNETITSYERKLRENKNYIKLEKKPNALFVRDKDSKYKVEEFRIKVVDEKYYKEYMSKNSSKENTNSAKQLKSDIDKTELIMFDAKIKPKQKEEPKKEPKQELHNPDILG